MSTHSLQPRLRQVGQPQPYRELTTPTPSLALVRRTRSIPVINVTDLYHPFQDPGDNIDLLMGYGLEEIDLKAVILDVTEEFRHPHRSPEYAEWGELKGVRDPGFIPVTQLNYIFDRNVSCAVGPFTRMRSQTDTMEDVPRFQQSGIELIVKTLSESPVPVDIVIFGSARSVAVAYNRDPDLLRQKVRRVHLCAGASSPEYLEWNVHLDPWAIVSLLRSDLPIAVYPCATQDGPFSYGPYNTYWQLPDLWFMADMHPKLRRYLTYALMGEMRSDFLRAIDFDPPPDDMVKAFSRSHHVWETAVWCCVAGRHIVQKADGRFALEREVEAHEDGPTADAVPKVLTNALLPCVIDVHDDGRYSFYLTDASTNRWIYFRGNPLENERALRQAVPNLYRSFLR